MVGRIAKEKIGELEEEVREEFSRRIYKGVDWCGPRSLWEEEVIGDFSGWVKKGSGIKSAHLRDSR